jgi:hypothetical protein
MHMLSASCTPLSALSINELEPPSTDKLERPVYGKNTMSSHGQYLRD